jgi:hypothetical protein
LYSEFTGHTPDYYQKIDVPEPKSALHVGSCDGILYTTVRDGVQESYIHKFKKTARPAFCVASNGKQILLVGGNFNFTERGIVDN